MARGDFLTRYATKVHMVMDARLLEILGTKEVEGVRYEHSGEIADLPVQGVFIFVGFMPNSGLLNAHIDHDAGGYRITDAGMQTSVPGVWAVGDVRTQLTRQISTAVGDGTTAAVAASAYIERWRDSRRRAGEKATAA